MGILVRPDDRIIELAPPDTSTAADLLAQGCDRYLGLIPEDSYDRFVADAGLLADRYRPMSSAMCGIRNNADVLLLHGPFARLLWEQRLGQARMIATAATGSLAAEAWLASSLRRREVLGHVRWGAHRYRVLASDPGRRRTSARHYTVDAAHLLDRLEDENVRYVVLRWFDDLPEIEPGEDLDLLVADEDLETVHGVLDASPGTFPVDLYTVSGLPGTDFRSVAYYPPPLAVGLLARSERHRSGYRVPSPRDHFLSLAYHALYHKGGGSGLPSTLTDRRPGAAPDHDYRAHLEGLKAEAGFDGPLTMEALDAHLHDAGWRPPRDTLARLAPGNPWIRRRFFPAAAKPPEPPLLTLFVLRDVASTPAVVEALRDLATEQGFDVVLTHRLIPTEREQCTLHMRGGNWGRGPFPVSGGGPAVVLAALDDHPLPPTANQRRRFPGLDNARTVTVKEAFRARFQASLGPDARCNPIHTSDGQEDAWHYLELAAPAARDQLAKSVASRRARRAEGPSISAPPGERGPAALRAVGARARTVGGWARAAVRRAFRAVSRRLVRRRVRTAYPSPR
jgi:hypothetical protein